MTALNLLLEQLKRSRLSKNDSELLGSRLKEKILLEFELIYSWYKVSLKETYKDLALILEKMKYQGDFWRFKDIEHVIEQ